MRIVIVASGSRGDVQPMLAVALGLRTAGHDVTFCSSPDNAPRARSHGCPFEPIGSPLRDDPALGDWISLGFLRFIRRQLVLQLRDLPRVVESRDLVVASGLALGARPVAERLGVAYRYVAFTPAGLLATTGGPIAMRLGRWATDAFADLVYGSPLNRGRRRLGLPPVRGVMPQLLGRDPIAATDPALTLLPGGARLRATQTGYPLLPELVGLSAPLRRFLDAGPPPLYAGFGSMPVGDRVGVGRLLVAAAAHAGQRLVVSRGWGRIAAVGRSDTVLVVDDEPHALLFPLVSAVIHHGGAGTVATAARAAVPQIVLPLAADQFLWRGQVVGLGLGPRAPSLRLASVRALSEAITLAVSDASYRERAQGVAARLAAGPDGVSATVEVLTRDVTSARSGPRPAGA